MYLRIFTETLWWQKMKPEATQISIQQCIFKQMGYTHIMKHYAVVLDISWVSSHILSVHILLQLLL